MAKPARQPGELVRWYRPKIKREDLALLNRRSDWKGFRQALGFLGVLIATGSVFVWTAYHAPWLALPMLLVHGACCAFLVNGFHELVHDSVFRTRWLNRGFLYIFSFLGTYNHVGFWASHTEHHKFTLHPPDDLEEVLPRTVKLKQVLRFGFIDLNGIKNSVLGNWRTARGRLSGEWETHLFTKIKPDMRPAYHAWARTLLVGHGLIIIGSLATGYWPIIFAVTFARHFGMGLQFLVNSTQHIGLIDEYPDFRVCCRTITLNPVLSFLYWNMNFHTEHHMFAGVPCYNLPKLHRLIRHELPPTTHGLIRTWLQISPILKRQELEPGYEFFPAVPPG